MESLLELVLTPMLPPTLLALMVEIGFPAVDPPVPPTRVDDDGCDDEANDDDDDGSDDGVADDAI